MRVQQIQNRYTELLQKYGPRGWWPVTIKGRCTYHPGDYSYPRTAKQRFEICIGAILTQNTAWKNVEKALGLLHRTQLMHPKRILAVPEAELQEAIKPSGYFRQKSKKLREFCRYYTGLKDEPSRDGLLTVWGIGRETADSILLYAYRKPFFVVDAYTRRVFSDILAGKGDYDQIRLMFENSLPADYRVYQEYHAVIVEHAKRKLPLHS